MLIDNIISQADVKTRQEYRVFICKMNREVIREITHQSYGKSYSPQLGGCDAFSFSIPKMYDGKLVANYNDIVGRNLIKVQKGTTPIGYFEIQNVQIENDGIKEAKNIKAYSAETKLINKKIYLTEGVFKFVNDANPSSGIMNVIISKIKSWTIGYIDPVLINKERYFDIADTNIYELMVNKIQETYECVFIFDTINKQINAYALDNFGNDSPIIISLQNILKDASVEELSEEIVTRLHLYGDNEISIRDINFGNDFIDNFSYFKNSRFMSDSLINALNAYDVLVASYSTTYTNYLNSLYSLESQLVVAESDLLILQGELTALLEQKSYLQSLGQSTTSIQVQINNKQIEVNTKTNQINSLQSNINSVNASIDEIVNILDVDNNFTTLQQEELDQFIIEDTYQDSSFLVADSATYPQSIDVQKSLKTAGTNILARVSYPRYRLNINVIDFLKNKEFSPWWDKLFIGDIIRIDIDGAFVANVRVTSYTHDWDSNNLTIQLGDKYQFDDANIQLMDLLKSSISTGTSVNFERYKYKDYTSNNKNDILSFINSALDLSKNAVIGGTNQELLLDSTGLLMRRYDTSISNYSPKQLKITNNAIVLTDDAFTTAKTAIGQLPNGLYGIAAEVIAGKMILGNNMIIETGSGDFRVDGSGVNITKMALNLTSGDNLKNILIDPTVGIKIRSRQTTSQAFVDRFYFDNTTGKFKFNGDLEAVGGTFSGTVSAASIVSSTIDSSFINGATFTGGQITIGGVGLGKVRINNFAEGGIITFLNSSSIEKGSLYYRQLSDEIQLKSLTSDISVSTFQDLILSGSTSAILSSSGRLSLESFSGDIRFNTTPSVGGTDYLASRNWVFSQGYISVSQAYSTFIQRGTGSSNPVVTIGASSTQLFVVLQDGTVKTIDFN